MPKMGLCSVIIDHDHDGLQGSEEIGAESELHVTNDLIQTFCTNTL